MKSLNADERKLESLAAPVYVLWNPYNVELRVLDKGFMTRDGLSEDPTIAHTQRIDCPYEFRFGLIAGAGFDFDDIVPNVGESALMGPELPITAAPALELPTAPIGSWPAFQACG